MTSPNQTIDTAFLNRQEFEIAAEWAQASGLMLAHSKGVSWRRPTAPRATPTAPTSDPSAAAQRRKAALVGLVFGFALFAFTWIGGTSLAARLSEPTPSAPVAPLIW